MKDLPQFKLVKFDFKSMRQRDHSKYPFSIYQTFVMIGEIEQMPGHCIVIENGTGAVHTCFHTDDFIELTEDEI